VHALARQAQEEGRYEDAEALLRQLLTREEPGADAAHALGVCLLARGRWAEAHAAWAAAAATSAAGEHAALRAQAAKDAAFWPAPGAPRDGGAEESDAAAPPPPPVADVFRVPLLDAGCAGADAVVTRAPLLAAARCAAAVAAAEAAAAARGGWTTSRHYAVPTTDLPLHEVPSLLSWFNDALATRIAPLLAAAYPDAIAAPARLRVHDAFVVRYDAAAQRSLPVHSDQSMFSLTLALNGRAEYEGGGTYFAETQAVISPDVGHLVAFPGDARHGGEPITTGVRYIIAAFLYVSA
jgi:predicted 2-oxoglutarate/Fe(II)-dependent dioxygenase YbiX